jgi:hypothetical protein
MRYILFVLALMLNLGAYSQSENDANSWNYEIEGISKSRDIGTYVVKVWCYTKKPKIDYNIAKKNAIHGLIFRGYVKNGNLPALPPISNVPGLEQTQKDFFEQFFRDGGDYLKYVALSNENLAIAPGDLIRLNKGYKIGMVLTVNKNLLQRDLIAAGIVKSMDNGF